MADCQRCTAKTDLHLCNRCQVDLRDLLTGLAVGQRLPSGQHAAGFLEYLEDAVLGRTRLGESARRSSECSRPALVRLTNNEADSFAGSPSELLDNVHAMLERWAETISLHTETMTIEGKETA